MIHGNGADMAQVANGTADLVITSPPYFSEETEALLKRGGPFSTQDLDTVRAQATEFALTLRPVFAEVARVLAPGRAFVLQTKDLRVGDFLLELADLHREMAESVGLYLCTRVLWERPWRRRRGIGRRELIESAQSVGGFRADDVEEFLIFSDAGGLLPRDAVVELPEAEIRECVRPLWVLPPGAGPRPHPYQSPASVLRRLMTLLSAPGDVVVDPFAGHATVLRIAVRMGRRAIGYEIDRGYAETAERLLELAAKNAEKQ